MNSQPVLYCVLCGKRQKKFKPFNKQVAINSASIIIGYVCIQCSKEDSEDDYLYYT
jgi:Zn ribbon nucleic-acid-binding protein